MVNNKMRRKKITFEKKCQEKKCAINIHMNVLNSKNYQVYMQESTLKSNWVRQSSVI